MRPERNAELKRILVAALERKPSARAAFLAEACADDSSLKEEVESLLEHEAEVHRFLHTPAPAGGEPVIDDAPSSTDRTTASEADAEPERGALFEADRFEILEPLGAGGMGVVYRAHDHRMHREVALKTTRGCVDEDEGLASRFEQEAMLASSLNHPNIVTIYDVEREGPARYIAMEYIKGQTLRQLLREGPLPTPQLVRIATQLAAGLASAHKAGIIHRDLKPTNVMITEEGTVKILDLGLAKLAPLSSAPTVTFIRGRLTATGVLVGTVAYMSPEQATGGPIDHRADQFALGVIMYEMASGKAAFRRETHPLTLTAIVDESPEPLSGLSADLPPGFLRIVERCLDKDRDQRYGSTRDLFLALRSIDAGSDDILSAETVDRPLPTLYKGAVAVAAAVVAALTIRGCT